MELHLSYSIPTAFILDMILGDPCPLPHPVRWMGKAIMRMEPVFRRLPFPLVISGTLLTGFLVPAVWMLTFLLVHTSGMVHPVIRFIVETICIYYCISPSSLRTAAMDVRNAFASGGLAEAREAVSRIVGRETRNLTEQGVIRATIETAAENLVDGVISPLLYAAIGGAPLAMTYRMINTLDSMVGYKNDAYILFGKASARLDDIANFIPARLCVPVIALAVSLLAGIQAGKRSFQTAIREGAHHASPNSGYPEAAFAGALSVRLNGPAVYHGQTVRKPYIGVSFGDVTLSDIPRACDIMICAAFLWTALLAVTMAIGCL